MNTRMIWRTALFVVVMMVFAVPAGAAPGDLEVGAGFGVNACVDGDDSGCDDTENRTQVLLTPELRISDHVGIGVDLSMGWLGNERSTEIETITFHVIPMLRVHVPLPFLDVFGGAGMGFGVVHSEGPIFGGADFEATWTSLTTLKLSGGAGYSLTPRIKVGVQVDYLAQLGGEVCTEVNYGASTLARCGTVSAGRFDDDDDDDDAVRNPYYGDDTDMLDLVQVGFFLKYTL